MDEHANPITTHKEIKLRSPILIAAFRGWNDAGDAASFAATHLGSAWEAQKVASIDPEDFYDFQAVRPQVQLIDGITRHITWPANEFWAARNEAVEHDVLLLVGTEPNLRWRAFSELILDKAQSYGVELVITFGALLADVPHSRPVPITGTAADPALIAKLGLTRSRYEGPTGIVGVLNDAFSRQGVDSASLWAAVPHYIAVSPNPKAALALINKASQLIGIPVNTSELEHAAVSYEEKVTEMVAADEDVDAYVKLLEERSDENTLEEIDPTRLPSGDALAAELERYLRDKEEDQGGS
jgi:proteasome assembly chaperone (PAC2) family protein